MASSSSNSSSNFHRSSSRRLPLRATQSSERASGSSCAPSKLFRYCRLWTRQLIHSAAETMTGVEGICKQCSPPTSQHGLDSSSSSNALRITPHPHSCVHHSILASTRHLDRSHTHGQSSACSLFPALCADAFLRPLCSAQHSRPSLRRPLWMAWPWCFNFLHLIELLTGRPTIALLFMPPPFL